MPPGPMSGSAASSAGNPSTRRCTPGGATAPRPVWRRSSSARRRRTRRAARSPSAGPRTSPQCGRSARQPSPPPPPSSTAYRWQRSGPAARATPWATARRAAVVPDPGEPTTSRPPSGGSPRGRSPALLVREVDPTQHDLADVAPGQLGHGQDPRQRVDPRPAGRGAAERVVGGRDGVDQGGERRPGRVAVRRTHGDRRAGTEAERLEPHGGARRVGGPGRPRRLHLDQLGRAAAHQGPAREVPGQADRGGGAHHVGALGRVLHPQRDAQAGVGPDVVAHRAARPLGGEHEVHPQAPAPLGDRHQRVDEAGHLLLQGGELVHDHGQPGQRPTGRAGGEVVVERAAPGGPQGALAVAQLGLQAAERPFGQSRVEVGHEPDRVREPGAGVEGGAALVVHEHEGQDRRVDRRRPGRPPGSGGARTCRSPWCPPRARGARRRPGRG